MRAHSRYLRTLKRKYRTIRLAEIFLFSAGGASLVFLMSFMLNVSRQPAIALSGISGVVFFAICFFAFKLHKLEGKKFISFINRYYPDMQQSTDLLFADGDNMTTLQRIQQEIIGEKFAALYTAIKLPNRIGKALAISGVAMGASLTLVFFLSQPERPIVKGGPNINGIHTPNAPIPVSVKEILVRVNPPAYTRVSPFKTKNPDLAIPSGSTVSWNIVFTDSVADAALHFSAGDSILLRGAGTAARRFLQSTLYQLAWKSGASERKFSKYFKIEVLADRPPKIEMRDQPPYREVEIQDNFSIEISCDLTDDYGVMDAYIVATVTKGSGESVKFREEKIALTPPERWGARKVRAAAKINLRALGMEPGDELYFYVEALDNQTPLPNRARTETLFIALRDTVSENFSADGGMGVDVMPEYFRSQRQIIIDSEKLLRERIRAGKAEFNRRSNELGYDQKMLRLKYGEFLGEEFESAIGPAAHEDHDVSESGEDKNPLDEYTHHHDTDNEHNLVPERKETGHNHETHDETGEDPLAAYRHVHDDPEEATFFTGMIRTKLKAALAFMWDAELHLRLGDPKTSLPFQYKALRLLKEISNASRIYVHKTGFDAPPLKEDRRLSGDLSEVRKNARDKKVIDKPEEFPAARYALIIAEQKLQQRSINFSAPETDAMMRAGHELASRSLDEPGKYLEALAAINTITENNSGPERTREALLLLRKTFWTALPERTTSPSRTTESHHPLEYEFLEKLKRSDK